jgi:hypothetical protein
MKAIGYFTLLFLTMSLISCSSGTNVISNGGAAAVSAPGTLAGKTYRVTVESGSGVFATTGTFTVDFLSSQPFYTRQGDGINIGDSFGFYIYSSSGDSGTVKIEDSSVPNTIFLFTLTFSTAISGTYFATATADVNSRQSGTFTER